MGQSKNDTQDDTYATHSKVRNAQKRIFASDDRWRWNKNLFGAFVSPGGEICSLLAEW